MDKYLEKMKTNKVVALLLLTVVMLTMILCINNRIGMMYNDKISVTSFDLKKIDGKSQNESSEVKSYDRLSYLVKYKLSSVDNQVVNDRTAVITATLSEDEIKYANWNLIEGDNVESKVSDDGTTLTITINGLTTETEYNQKLTLKVVGAPDKFEFKPKIEINESTNTNAPLLKTTDIKVSTSSITGTVRDSKDNSIIKNLELSICKVENQSCKVIKQTTTDENGNYNFSDLSNGEYRISIINNSEYENIESEIITINNNSQRHDLVTVNNGKFNSSIKKYIKKIIVNKNGEETSYDYNEINKVVLSLKKTDNSSIKVLYEFKIKNEGTKQGYVKVVKEDIPENMEIDNENPINEGWVLNNNAYYNKTLAKTPLKSGEEKILNIQLKSKGNLEAGTYMNVVKSISEQYHVVNYIIDDEVIKQEIVLDGDKINYSTIPEKDGYKILGWYTDKEGKNKWNFDNYVENDMNLYATYKSDMKKITYHNPLVKYTVVDNVKYGDKTKEPDKDNKVTGYTFKCWQVKNEENKTGVVDKEKYDESACYNFGEPVKEDLTLVSVYTINEYTVKFMNKDTIDGNYSQYGDIQNVKYGNLISFPKEPTIDEYEFSGWYTSEDDGKTLSDNPYDSLKPVTKNLVLYSDFAKNIMNVKFKVGMIENGIFNEKMDEINQKVKKGSSIAKPTEPSLVGYTFDDWYTDETLTTKYNFDDKINEDTIIYGKLNYAKRTVIFKIPENEYDKTWKEYKTVIVDDGTSVEKPEDPEFSTCLNFDGNWYTSDNDGQTLNKTPYNFDEKVKNDMILYASVNVKDVTVTYLDECSDYKKEKIKCGEIPSRIDKPRGSTGKAFKCWVKVSSKDSCSNEITNKLTCDDPNVKTTEDTTYTAVYEDIGSVKIEHDPKIWTNNKDILTMTKENTVTKEEYENKLETPISYGFNVSNNGNVSTLTSQNIDITSNDENYAYSYFTVDQAKTLNFEAKSDSKGTGYIYITEDENEIRNLSVGLIDFTNNVYSISNKNEKAFEYTFDANKKYYVALIHKSVKSSDYSNLFQIKISESNSEKAPVNSLKSKEVQTNVNLDDYDIYYKLDGDLQYELYDDSNKPEVKINTKVYARLVNRSTREDSIVSEHLIDNIDKVAPRVDNFSQGDTTINSIKVKIASTDLNDIVKVSGIKNIIITKNGEEVKTLEFGSLNQGNKTEETEILLDNLESSTTYKIGGKVIDYAGNETIIDDVDMTTDEDDRTIIAQIIGRNGSLFDDENQYEKFYSLNDAIESCGKSTSTCTIQMVNNTIESNTILDGQNISIDLNNKKIESDEQYTLDNLGTLQIYDSVDDFNGGVFNTKYGAIHNQNTLLVGYIDDVVYTTKPIIDGKIYGVVDDGNFSFYDGVLKGDTLGFSGTIEEYPEGYNPNTDSVGGRQETTLQRLTTAVAKIERTGTTYSTIESALEDANNGTYTETKSEYSILTQIQHLSENSANKFEYINENDEEYISPVLSDISDKRASGYIKIDLTKETTNKLLKVKGDFSGFKNNDYFAVFVDDKPNINWSDIEDTNYSFSSSSSGKYADKTLLYYNYASSSSSAKYFNNTSGKVYLEPGKVYYLNFAYENYESNSSTSNIWINEISITNVIDSENSKTIFGKGSDLMTQQDDGTLISTSKAGRTAVYHSIIPLGNIKQNMHVIYNYINYNKEQQINSAICIAKKSDRDKVQMNKYNDCVNYDTFDANTVNYNENDRYLNISEDGSYDAHIISVFNGIDSESYFKLTKLFVGETNNANNLIVKYNNFTKEDDKYVSNQIDGYEGLYLNYFDVDLTGYSNPRLNFNITGSRNNEGGFIIKNISSKSDDPYIGSWNSFRTNVMYGSDRSSNVEYSAVSAYSEYTNSLTEVTLPAAQKSNLYRIYFYSDFLNKDKTSKGYFKVNKFEIYDASNSSSKISLGDITLNSNSNNSTEAFSLNSTKLNYYDTEKNYKTGEANAIVTNKSASFDAEVVGDKVVFNGKAVATSQSEGGFARTLLELDYTNAINTRVLNFEVESYLPGFTMAMISDDYNLISTYDKNNQALLGENKVSEENGVYYANIYNSGTLSYNLKPGKKYYILLKEFVTYTPDGVMPDRYSRVKFNKDILNLKDDGSLVYYTDIDSSGKTTLETTISVPKLNEEADKIILLSNLNLTSPLTIENTRNVIIDLNGFNMLFQTNTSPAIVNNGSLKIMDSKSSDDATAKISNNYQTISNQTNSTLDIESGIIESTDTTFSNAVINNSGNFIFNGKVYVTSGYGINLADRSTISGNGTIKAIENTKVVSLLNIDNKSISEIKDLTFDTDGKGIVESAIKNTGNNNLTIDNITVYNSSTDKKITNSYYENYEEYSKNYNSDNYIKIKNSILNADINIKTNKAFTIDNVDAHENYIFIDIPYNYAYSGEKNRVYIKDSNINHAKVIDGALDGENTINELEITTIGGTNTINGKLTSNKIDNSANTIVNADVNMIYNSKMKYAFDTSNGDESNEYAIRNKSSISFYGKLKTDQNYGRGIYNYNDKTSNPTITLGKNDLSYNKDDIDIKSKNTAVRVQRGTFNYYDGKLKGYTENTININSIATINVATNMDIEVNADTENKSYENINLSDNLHIAEIVETDANGNETIIDCTDSSKTCPSIQKAFDKIDEITDVSNYKIRKIRLLKDVYTVHKFTFGTNKKAILDFNNHNVKNYTSDTFIVNNGELEVTNSKNDESKPINVKLNYKMFENSASAKLTLKNISINESNISYYLIENYGTLSINNLSYKGKNKFLYNSGKVTMTDSKLDNANTYINYKAEYIINNHGEMELNNATVYSLFLVNNSSKFKMIGGDYDLSGSVSISHIINSGEMEVTKANIDVNYNPMGVVAFKNSGIFKMNDSTLNVEGLSNLGGVFLENTNNATISNSTLKTGNIYTSYITNSGTLNVINNTNINGYINNTKNLTVENSKIKTGRNNKAISSTGKTQITTIKGTTTVDNSIDVSCAHSPCASGDLAPTVYAPDGTLILGEKDGDVSIEYPYIVSSKTFDTGDVYGISVSDDTIFNFYDGLIESYPDKTISGSYDELEEGYDLYITDDKTKAYLVSLEVVQILSGSTNHNNEKYKSIQDAVNVCDDNIECNIKLLNNKTYSTNDSGITIPNEKIINLDFNNNFITSYSSNTLFTNNGTFKIHDTSGEGNIKTYGLLFVLNNGTFEINDINTYQYNDSPLLENNGTATLNANEMASEKSVSNYLIKNNEGATINYSSKSLDKYAGSVFENYGDINYISGNMYFGKSDKYTDISKNTTYLFNNYEGATLTMLNGNVTVGRICDYAYCNNSGIVNTTNNNTINISNVKFDVDTRYNKYSLNTRVSNPDYYKYFIGSDGTTLTFNDITIKDSIKGNVYEKKNYDSNKYYTLEDLPLMRNYIFYNETGSNLNVNGANINHTSHYDTDNNYSNIIGYLSVISNKENATANINNLTEIDSTKIKTIENEGLMTIQNSTIYGLRNASSAKYTYSSLDNEYLLGAYNDKVDENRGTLVIDNTSYDLGKRLDNSDNTNLLKIINNSTVTGILSGGNSVLVDNSNIGISNMNDSNDKVISSNNLTVSNNSTINGNLLVTDNIIIGTDDEKISKEYPIINGKLSVSKNREFYDGYIYDDDAYSEEDFNKIADGSVVVNETDSKNKYKTYLSTTPFVKIVSGSTSHNNETYFYMNDAINACDDNTKCELKLLRNGGKGENIVVPENKQIEVTGEKYEIQGIITNNGKLVIDNSSKINSINNNSNVTITNSTISKMNTIESSMTTIDSSNVIGDNIDNPFNNAGTMILKNTTLLKDAKANSTGILTVNGGTTYYLAFDPDNTTFENNVTAEGELVTQNSTFEWNNDTQITPKSLTLRVLSNSRVRFNNDSLILASIENGGIIDIENSGVKPSIIYNNGTLNINKPLTLTTLTNNGKVNANDLLTVTELNNYGNYESNNTSIVSTNINNTKTMKFVGDTSITSKTINTTGTLNFENESKKTLTLVDNKTINTAGTLNLKNVNVNDLLINQTGGNITIDNTIINTSKLITTTNGNININDSNITLTSSLISSTSGNDGKIPNNIILQNNRIIATGNSNSLIDSNYYQTTKYPVEQNNYSITIDGGEYTSDSNVINNAKELIIKNAILTSVNSQAIIGKTKTLTLGDNSDDVTKESPKINSKEAESLEVNTFNIYDGTYYGALNTSNRNYPDGYRLNDFNYPDKNITSKMREIYLTKIADVTKIFEVNGSFYSSFQAAVNACLDNEETDIKLHENYTMTEDVIIPESKIINLYFNGYKIEKNGYTITNNGVVNIKDQDTSSGNLIGSIKNLLDTNKKISKNIILDTYDDGNRLLNEGKYTIQMYDNDENKYVTVGVDEKIDDYGRYTLNINSSNTLLNPINSKIYINNIGEGNYKIVDQYNNEVTFNITNDGKILGNAKENFSKINSNNRISMSLAELIISIQTGIIPINYILFILITIISILTLVVIKTKMNKNLIKEN